MSHCLRGIFDGDGCVSRLSGVNQVGVRFYSGSVPFLRQISQFFIYEGLCDGGFIKPSGTIHNLSWYRTDFVYNIGTFLYKDSENLRIRRKYGIWKDFL